MNTKSQTMPSLTDERVVRITKRVEIQATCSFKWIPSSADEMTPVQALAYSSEEWFSLDHVLFRCLDHGCFFSIKSECPQSARMAEPGEEVRLPYWAACGLLARREAETMEIDVPEGEDQRWSTRCDEVYARYGEKAGLPSDPDFYDDYFTL